ncbi:hypothetical protein NC651_040343 [Populus alba x Populus x berolinensis]|nr:hypothetical protein NC651_040343 [Populus alba x Populus x berolinensis]
MSRTDRAFATPYFHLTFSGLLLNRFPQELSDHCPMILGLQCQTWRWKPFRFLNCQVSKPMSMDKLEGLCQECSIKDNGKLHMVKKLAFMAMKFRIWNRKEFGNQDLKLLQLLRDIQRLENIEEDKQLNHEEPSMLQILRSKPWEINKFVESICSTKSRQTWCKPWR